MKKIMEKMLAIRKDIGSFMFDAKGYNYEFASGSQVSTKFREIANNHNVMLIFTTKNCKIQVFESIYKDTKKGFEKTKREFLTTGTIVYRFFDIDSCEEVKTEMPLWGLQSDPSQSVGAALTYAERYLINKEFNVPTDKDDPDAKIKDEKVGKYEKKNSEYINHPKAIKNKWGWEDAPVEFLLELSSTSDNPDLVDNSDKEQHRRNMVDTSSKILEAINKELRQSGAETIEGYLYCDCVDALRKLEEK